MQPQLNDNKVQASAITVDELVGLGLTDANLAARVLRVLTGLVRHHQISRERALSMLAELMVGTGDRRTIHPGIANAASMIGQARRSGLEVALSEAGRVMSRTHAIKTLKGQQMRDAINAAGITLSGAGLDEAPMVYKDLRAVMQAQKHLVKEVASFQPVLVRMADDRDPAED